MTIVYHVLDRIKRALNADAEPLDRARMHILYALGGNVLFTILLIGAQANLQAI